MSKHTPGPWEAVGGLVRTAVRANDRGGMSGGLLVAETALTDEERFANARLISAAPDLLDEARKQVTWLRHLRTEAVGSLRGSLIDGIDQSIKYLSAAIDKAEGKL